MLNAVRNWFRRQPKEAKAQQTQQTEPARQSAPGKIIRRGEYVNWVPKSGSAARPSSNGFPYEIGPPLLEENGVVHPGLLDPRILFPILRRLRDFVPDVSAGVWAWVRLCATPQSMTFSPGSETEQNRAKEIINALDHRIYGCHPGRERGVEALVQTFFISVFTYGSFSGEVVLDESRRRLERFVVIDPATIRFKLDRRERLYRPFQIQADGSTTPLNPMTFFYYGLDSDGLSPYGRSPLLALPLVVKLQQQMIHDMAQAQHNAGYPTIHFQLQQPERIPGENTNDYNQRLNETMQRVQQEVNNRSAEGNLVTYDNMEVQYLGPNGNAMLWPESMQAISEQVVSALHLAPFMIGRNWGTTETWGTAQYQLLTNNARTVQEGAKRLAEWLRNLELSLHHSPLTVSHHFAPHHHLDVLNRARAFQVSANTFSRLMKEGLLEENDAKQRIENLIKMV